MFDIVFTHTVFFTVFHFKNIIIIQSLKHVYITIEIETHETKQISTSYVWSEFGYNIGRIKGLQGVIVYCN